MHTTYSTSDYVHCPVVLLYLVTFILPPLLDKPLHWYQMLTDYWTTLTSCNQDLLVPCLLEKGIAFSSVTLRMVPGIPIKPMLAKYICFSLGAISTVDYLFYYHVYCSHLGILVNIVLWLELPMEFHKCWRTFRIKHLRVNISKSLIFIFCLDSWSPFSVIHMSKWYFGASMTA